MAVQFVPESSPIKALLDPYFQDGGGSLERVCVCVSFGKKDV